MNKTTLSFEQINPFIRYPHLFSIEPNHPLVEVKAYDYRLMYIYDGSGHFVIDDILYEVSKGHLFLWGPNVKYTIHPDSKKQLSIIGVNFDYTYSNCEINYPIPPEGRDNFNVQNVIEVVEFSDLPSFNKPIFLKNMQSLESSLLELANEYNIRKRYFLHKIRGNFLIILSDIARNITTANSTQDNMNNKVDLIIQYIHTNYNKSLTNENIGEYFNFHPIYINRLMVRYTGYSLHQYLVQYRISVSINLLQSTTKSITEIAFLVGFKDINYFSKYFKKMVGLSPKNYIANSRGSF